MAITESDLAWCSNSSNSLTASFRPRFPERTRAAMARSSSKHRSRAALAQRDMSAWGGKWPGHEREGRRRMRRWGLASAGRAAAWGGEWVRVRNWSWWTAAACAGWLWPAGGEDGQHWRAERG